MRDWRRILWLVLTLGAVLGLAWGTVSGVRRAERTPDAPADRTLAALAEGPAPAWIRLVDGVPRCDRVLRANNHDVVPVVPAADPEDAPTRVLLIALENDELCASLRAPLLVSPLGGSAYAARVLEEARVGRVPVVAGDVFGLEPDAVAEARDNVVIPALLMLVAIAGLLWQLRSLRSLRAGAPGALGAVGAVAAAPAGGAFDALARGAQVDGQESLLPPAPLVVSLAAERQAWRARYVGSPFLVLCGLALALLCGWGSVGVVNDLRAWYGGIEVPAELKGSTTSKLIVSFVDVQIAWQMPDQEGLRTQRRWFMTLWMADDDAGRVRALPDNPEVVTFEEAVDLVPFRVPLLLLGFAAAVGSVVSARNTRRNAGRVHHIAASGVEARLFEPRMTETRVNGATTGWVLSGVLDGKAVTLNLPPQPGPPGLVMADGSGALLVVKSADGSAFVPLCVDGEPFAWTPAAWARAQAVLQARGSPSRLAG